MSNIQVKTLFNGWLPISEENARKFARWNIRAITMGKSDRERLEMVNRKFTGITFTLEDLGLK